MSPNNDFNIRQATKSDVNNLFDLEYRCFDEEQFSKKRINYLVTKAKGFVLIIETGKKLVGSIVLLKKKNAKNLRIYSLAIDPNYRGKGLSKKLLKKAEITARENNIEYLSLEVKKTNKVAIDLYLKEGFCIQKEIEKYYSDNCNAFVMHKNCNPNFN